MAVRAHAERERDGATVQGELCSALESARACVSALHSGPPPARHGDHAQLLPRPRSVLTLFLLLSSCLHPHRLLPTDRLWLVFVPVISFSLPSACRSPPQQRPPPPPHRAPSDTSLVRCTLWTAATTALLTRRRRRRRSFALRSSASASAFSPWLLCCRRSRSLRF